MLNVPKEDASPEPAKVEATPVVIPDPTPSLAELGELAEQVRAAHGPDSQLVEVDGKLVVLHPVPTMAGRERGALRFDTSSPATGAVLALLIVAGLAFGWTQRSFFLGENVRRSHYRPATADEAHRFLSKNSVDPMLKVANRPRPTPVPLNVPPLKFTPGPDKTGDSTTNPSRSFSPPDQGLTPMPPPLQGQIGSALPNPSSSPLVVSKEPEQPAPKAELHGLEAKLRTCIASAGARIVRVREGGNFKTFYVSTSSAKVQALSSKIESRMEGAVSVSEPSDDESDAQGLDEVKASEIKAAETSLTSLKKQLDQAEISFLPEAPALKSLRAQYAQALADLTALRKQAHPNSTVKVTLSAN